MKSRIIKIMSSGMMLMTAQYVLGIIFVTASIGKLLHPDAFTSIVANYNLLPSSLAMVFGQALPWIELVLGTLMILGLFTRITSALYILLITSFIIADSTVLFSGTTGACGCFGNVVPLSNTGSLIINILILPAAVLLVFGKSYPESRLSSSIGVVRKPIRFLFSRQFRFALLSVTLLISLVISNLAFQGKHNPLPTIDAVSGETVNDDILSDIETTVTLSPDTPALVYFYSDDCRYCQQETPIIDELETTFGDTIRFIRINALQNSEAADDFGITSLPSIYLIQDQNATGEYEYREFRGFTEKKILSQYISDSLYVVSTGQRAGFNDDPVRTLSAKTLRNTLLSGYSPVSTMESDTASQAVIRVPGSLNEVWEWAKEAGNYRFTADIEQTLVPRPVTNMIGETSQRVEMKVDGKVMLPDNAELQLGIKEVGTDINAVRLIQTGQDTFVEIDGNLELIENPLSGATVLADYLGYLAAAENVKELPAQLIDGIQLIGYSFDINGNRLSSYMGELIRKGLSSGETVVVSPVVSGMSGYGELWVDTSGLPRLQIMDLDIPGASADYDASSHVEIDFYDFGNIETIMTPLYSSADSTWRLAEYHVPNIPAGKTTTGPVLSETLYRNTVISLTVILILLLAVCLIRLRNSRRMIVTTSIALSVVILTPVLFQIIDFHRTPTRALAASTTMDEVVQDMLENDSTIHSNIASSSLNDSSEVQSGTIEPDLISLMNTDNYIPTVFDEAGVRCGDGEPGVDTDGDGLDDRTENCLGTNPYTDDSDMDGIPDNVELEGFQFNGTTWTGDPFKADSNMDGMFDMYEWAQSDGGTADSWDPDNDSVPNPWDEDNDNDGIPDGDDYAPFSKTDYAGEFTFTSEQPGIENSYQYITIQLQPENADHLRYGATVFDWPDDNKGNIQDLDKSVNDMRLMPVLKIEANIAPEQELARHYGVSVFPNEDPTDKAQYPHLLYIPLSSYKVNDQTVAFQSKVVYEPESQADVRWKMKVVWIVMGNLDSKVWNGTKTTTMPVQEYPEDSFRLAGLQVTKSGVYTRAIFGTPTLPDDDKNLFNLIFGLSGSYLKAEKLQVQGEGTSILEEIRDRFESASTQDTLLWGVERLNNNPSAKSVVEVDLSPVYAHEDEAYADISQRTRNFLSNYSGFDTATLVFAYEQTSGGLSMDALDGQQLHFNLADIPMMTERGVSLQMFKHQGAQWSGLDLTEILEVISTRYSDLTAELVELQAVYPDISDKDLMSVLLIFYTTWWMGRNNVFSLDTMKLSSDTSSDEALFAFLNRDLGMTEYLLDVGNLAQPGAGLNISDIPSENWEFLRSQETTSIADLGLEGLVIAGVKKLAEAAKTYIAPPVKTLFRSISAIRVTYQALKTAKQIEGLKGLAKLSNVLKSFPKWTGFKNFLKNNKLGIAGTIVSIGLDWLAFGLSTDWDDPVAVTKGAVTAAVSTAVSIALFIVSMNPVGAILAAVFAIVDLLCYFIGGFSIMGEMINAISMFFYDANTLTEIESVEFKGADSTVKKHNAPVDGLVVGNKFVITDSFTGLVRKTGGGHVWSGRGGAYGFYKDETTLLNQVLVTSNNKKADWSHLNCSRSGNLYTCKNQAGLIYQFLVAKPNVEIKLSGWVNTWTQYEECTLWIFCWTEDEYTLLPEDPDPPTSIYLDVLPDTLDKFWNWDLTPYSAGHVFNPDRTLSPLPDPFVLDSDNDGVSDGYETIIGTLPDNNDSDGDGLLDGEEVFHLNPTTGLWEGGWDIQLVNGDTTRVYSDPMKQDADGDGIIDKSEKASGLSPYAYNDAPRLILNSSPIVTGPKGESGVYVEPGDTVTVELELFNSSPYAINSTLDLCFTSEFLSYTGGDLSGHRTPAKQEVYPAQCGDDPNGTLLSWNFGEDEDTILQLLESAYTSITLPINPGLAESRVAKIHAGILYDDGTNIVPIEQIISVNIDAEIPLVTITAPENNTLLGGGITDYVLGGTASDDTTWIDRVDINLPGGMVTAEGTDEWAYTWHLPSDGVYTLQARAYDNFGHASTPDSIQVRIDNTPPSVAIIEPLNGEIVSSAGGDDIVILLHGTVIDNLSGVARVQISLNDRQWQEVSLAGSAWSYEWVIPGTDSAQGQHIVKLRAFDIANNLSEPAAASFIVDVVPPTSELTDNTFLMDTPSYPTGESMVLRGVANDAGNVPEPSRPAELLGTLNSITDATIWLEPSSVFDNDNGIGVEWIGDFNGDRLSDLAIGLPAIAEGAGRITVLYGQAGGWPVPPGQQMIDDSYTSFIGLPGAGIGLEMAAAGDVNSDGMDDLLIADLQNNRVHLVFGNTGILGRDRLLDEEPDAGVTTILSVPDGYAIKEVSAAGDVNGDGMGDIFVTTERETSTINEKQVSLVLGDSLWLPQVDAVVQAAIETDLPVPDAFIRGAGDLDGDQLDDFVVSVPGDDVYVFYGTETISPLDCLSYSTDDGQVIKAAQAFTDTEMITALGDSSGDGLADFALDYGDSVYLCRGNTDRNLSCSTAAGPFADTTFLYGVGNVHDEINEGLADLLVGQDGNAVLYMGTYSGFSYAATITGVAEAAGRPLYTEADLNLDGSSDLLLVPDESAAADLGLEGYGQPPAVDQSGLPSGGESDSTYGTPEGSGPVIPTSTEGTLYVDDDTSCGENIPCYSDIGTAVEAAEEGDLIIVYPGVYQPFTVNMTGLSISGVNADAVFIDGNGGAYGVRIENVTGTKLSNLTVRNCDRGIELIAAGVGGSDDTAKMTVLEKLLIYNYSSNAVWMDRVSTATLRQCTLAGDTTGSYIHIDENPDPAFAPHWIDIGSVVAVGDQGVILDFDGDEWNPMDSGTSERIHGVWGSSATDIWAAGYGGTILHYNGTYWASTTIGTADLYDIWRNSSNDIWAVGEEGTILHFDGDEWSPMSSPTSEWLFSVWGSSPSDVWAAGLNGTLLHYNGASWSSVPSGTGFDLDCIWGTSSNDVWAVGQKGTILHYNGSAWNPVFSGVLIEFLGVWGSSSSDVWAVGTSGYIMHYNGTSWSTSRTGGEFEMLFDVWGNSPYDVWVVGSDGIILHYNGSSWDPVPSGTTEFLYNIWGTTVPVQRAGGDLHAGPDGTLYVVKGGGSKEVWKLQSGATSWVPYTQTPVPVNTGSASMVDENGILWLLTPDGFYRYNGSAWATLINPAVSIEDGTVLVNSEDMEYAIAGGDKWILYNAMDGGGWSGTGKFEPVPFPLKSTFIDDVPAPLIYDPGDGRKLGIIVGGYGDDEFTILDVTDPTNVTIVSSTDGMNFYYAGGVIHQPGDGSTYLLTLAVEGYVSVVNMTDPLNPEYLGDWDEDWNGDGDDSELWINDIVTIGNLGLVVSNPGLNIIDLSQPENPQLISSVDPGGAKFSAIELINDHQAVLVKPGGDTHGLHVYDFSDPINPSQVSWLSYDADWVEMHGDYAYVLENHYYAEHNADAFLSIIDVSDPENLVVKSVLPMLYRLSWIEFYGDMAIIGHNRSWTTGWCGQKLIDISNPSDPGIVASQGIEGWPESWVYYVSSAAAIENYVFLAGGSCGLGPVDREDHCGLNLIDIGSYLKPAPERTGPGAAAEWVSGSMYLLIGGQMHSFYRYDAVTDAWTALAPSPVIIGPGASIEWDGGNYLYILAGSGGAQFMRYSISGNSWESLDDVPSDLAGIRAGAGTALSGGELYALQGGGFKGFWKYPLPDLADPPEKLVLDGVAYVATEASTEADWLSINPTSSPGDFGITDLGTSIWAGGTGEGTMWSHNPSSSTTYNLEEAGFLDPARDLYRLTSNAFNAGYHSYVPDVIISTENCEGDCIQEAIDSGTNRVIIESGSYQEDIYLVSGVNILGAGAGTVVLSGNGASSVINAEGIVGASVSGLTLTSTVDNVSGLYVDSGAQHMTFSRNILRDLKTAISVNGARTDLEVFNNTIVHNDNGMVAADGSAVDVRNTIFAYNEDSGLIYETTAASKLHEYNLYWGNGTDIALIDTPAEPDPGAGEIFLDPLFVYQFPNDYRTTDASPVIDAGNPGDPAPPGTGNRVDIGYLEQGRASFYVDDDYCSTCLNDGLTWGIDAFSTVQDGLDAAAEAIHLLDEALIEPHFTVGVAPGTYIGSVDIPSHVSLVGSGPDQTFIEGQTVTFQGVVDSEIRGFSITGSSQAGILATASSNHFLVKRNLIMGNTEGIRLADGATGDILFNTVVNNTIASLVSSGDRTWVEVRNNILAECPIGLRTENGGRIFHSYNLLYNTENYDDDANTGLAADETELVDEDPAFADALYRLSISSPAVDAADPAADSLPGGGECADIGYIELMSSPITLFLGDRDESGATANSGIIGVEYAVVPVADSALTPEETAPLAWTQVPVSHLGEGSAVRSWWAEYMPAEDGLHRIYSRAYDVVGNTETAANVYYSGSFLADNTSPVVEWLSPVGIITAPVELRAEVSDNTSEIFTVEQVYFEINGNKVNAEWAPIPWDSASGEPRVFRTWVTLNTGDVTARAFAVDRAGNSGWSELQTLTVESQSSIDDIKPELVIDTPEENAIVRGIEPVEFSGYTLDSGGSGIAGVEVSVDGGYTWMPATLAYETSDDAGWQFMWNAPGGQEFVSYPARVRALDNEGNSTELNREITVDNRPPQGLEPVTYSIDPGSHISIEQSLEITWQTPVDGSGQVQVVLTVDETDNTTPVLPVGGNSLTHTFAHAGMWYLHIGASDAAGNMIVLHDGPWYVSDALNPSCSNRQRIIVLDGFINMTGGEWDDENQRMGDDERPSEQQIFYTSWDSDEFFLAWDGAYWTLDGTMWVYIGVNSGGTINTITGQSALPFPAEYAVEVQDADTGRLWEYTATGWIGNPLEFAHGQGGETEIVVPFGTIDYANQVSLLAFAAKDTGEVWSMFPTSNPLSGEWTDFYYWADLCESAGTPNAGQPQAMSIDMVITSPQQGEAAWGSGDTLVYEAHVQNREYETINGLELVFTASEGLTYQSQSGAETCIDCTPGNNTWVMILPDMEPGTSCNVTIDGLLSSPAVLAPLGSVTTNAYLNLNGMTVAYGEYSHKVDVNSPTLEVFYNTGQVIAPGLQTILGSAEDGNGVGVHEVQWRQKQSGDTWGEWQTADGTRLWKFQVTVPAPNPHSTLELQLQASDYRNNVSEPENVSFIIDAVPPTVQFDMVSIPVIASGIYLDIRGFTRDELTEVTGVEINIDGGGWYSVSTISPPDPGTGEQTWVFTWDLPAEDGAIHTIDVRATDSVGNVSDPPQSVQITVDTVAPEIDATQLIGEIRMADYMGLPNRPAGDPVLAGTVSDGGSGVSQLLVTVIPPSGGSYLPQIANLLPDGTWTYAPLLVPPLGVASPYEFILVVNAVDTAGNDININSRMQFTLVATNTPPVADVGGPYEVDEGMPIELDASASYDDDSPDDIVLYTWDFNGDGEYDDAEGMITETVFDDNGEYQVSVMVTDIAGDWGTDTANVTVFNVPPVADAGPDQSQYWGLPVQFNGSVSDVSQADTEAGLQPTWWFGDGDSATGTPVSHIYSEPGTYVATLQATDKDGGMATDDATIVVNKRSVILSFISDTEVTYGYSGPFSARFTDAVDDTTSIIEGRAITFEIDGMQITGITDANGIVQVYAPRPVTPGSHVMNTIFNEDLYYLGSLIQTSISIANSIGKVTGGGIQMPCKGRGGFTVQCDDKKIIGELQYQNDAIKYHASEMTGLGISPDGKSAWFTGRSKDGILFIAYVEDNDESGTTDIFRLWIDGVLVCETDELHKGNIQVHKERVDK